MANKGQASTEFLLLLAVAFLVLTAVFLLSQNQLGGVSEWKEQNDAKNAVLDLSTAAKDVYSQGEGAKKRVYVELPSSYKPMNSSVSGNAIKINVRGSDYAAVEDFPVHGTLPGKSGGQWIWVVSEGNQVRIGPAMMELSKNSIFIIMNANTTLNDSFDIKNIWGSGYLATPSITWNNPNVSMSVNPSGSFALNNSESRTVSMSFSATGGAVGYYSGEIALSANDGSIQETVKVPVTVEVVGAGTGTEPRITITPDFWGVTLNAGDSVNKTFTICTNSFTAPTGITFTPSAGNPGNWVGGTAPLGPMDPSSCEQKTLMINVPNDTVFGNYSGDVDIQAQGISGGATDVSLYIVIIVQDEGASPPLTVTPTFWAEKLDSGETTNKTFTICTNNQTSVDNVTFAPSAGEPGDWVGGLSPLGAIAPGSCLQKTIDLAVPNDTLTDAYEGTIQVMGGGSPSAVATIYMYMDILGSDSASVCLGNESGYCNCPVGADYWGIPVCDCIPATIYVMDGIIHGGPDDGLPYNGTLRGGAGGDIIAGTNESDIIMTGSSGDRVCGHEGDDIIYGGNSGDLISGGAGNDIIYGNGSDDKIYGQSGDDIIYAGQGDDDIDAGSGNDIVYGGEGKDLIYGGPGDDEIYGGDGDDTICGNSEDDELYGETGNDDIDGGTGSNILDGGGDNKDYCYRGDTITNCDAQAGEYTICGPS
jgi:Ca2+-binding RTX toxin-like protein